LTGDAPAGEPTAGAPAAGGLAAGGLAAGGLAAGGLAAGHPAVGDSAAWFRDIFGAAPDGAWHAPGRVNLIGEHTDYNEGFVLPFALSRGTLAVAGRRVDSVLELHSRQVPGGGAVIPVGSLAPGAITGWAAYPAGVVWAMRAAGHPVGGVSMVFDSDVPRGAGLSSSAALECAVALALTDLYGLAVPKSELVTIAQRAENDFVGVPCGIMDQSASLLCQVGHALLLDCRTSEAAAVPFDTAAAGLDLLVIDTGARRELADGDYASRRGECEQAARALGVRALRDVSDVAEVSRLADPLLRRRARHVVTENQRVIDTVALLRAGRLSEAGALLAASHVSLRDDFEISWPEADATVTAATEAGALGARMIGGGFGGSVIALVPAAESARVRESVCAEFARRGWPSPQFLDATPSAGARRVQGPSNPAG
jgi:galactokinase